MDLRLGNVLLLTFAFALAGCADDGDGGEDGDPTDTPGPTGTGTMTTTTTSTTTMGPPTPMQQYVNGTATGVADCALLDAGAPPAQGSAQQVPAGMDGASYTLTTSGGQGTENVCMVFDDGTSGTSGVVPAGATSFTVYADGAPTGIDFSVLFVPVAA